MNEALGLLARGANPLIGAAAAVAGGVAGGGIYMNLSGIILGVVVGLGLCGLAAMMAVLVAGEDAGPPHTAMAVAGGGYAGAASAMVSKAAAQAAVPAVSVSSHGVNGYAMSASGTPPATPGVVTVGSTLPTGAPIAPVAIEATESEAQLLAAGKFAEYHLAKAKRLFEAKNFKEAAYQAAASLAHGDLPDATAVRKAALAAAKA